MSWVFLWLLLAIASTLVFVVFALSLARHAVIVVRTARRFRDEVGSVAEDVSRAGSAASDRAQGIRLRRKPRRS